jgi:nitronate monooxygenase
MTNALPPQVATFLALTGQTIPIMQAPIGAADTVTLATAVSRAGGLGGVALTWSNAAEAEATVRLLRAAGIGRQFYGNFVLHFPCEGFGAALDAGLPIVTFSFGVDAKRVSRAHRSGAIVGIQIGSAAGARRALDAGADFLIAQSVEAGGHVQSTTLATDLLPAVLAEAGAVPVMAAGGISTGEGAADVIAKGAAGAVMGTRFLATLEAASHDAYKAALVAARTDDTVLTNCFDVGWPFAMHRVLRNDTFNTWEAAGCPQPPNRPGEGEIVFRCGHEEFPRYSDTPPMSGATGALTSAVLYAGTGVGEIGSVEPAAEMLLRLDPQIRAALARRLNTKGAPS